MERASVATLQTGDCESRCHNISDCAKLSRVHQVMEILVRQPSCTMRCPTSIQHQSNHTRPQISIHSRTLDNFQPLYTTNSLIQHEIMGLARCPATFSAAASCSPQLPLQPFRSQSIQVLGYYRRRLLTFPDEQYPHVLPHVFACFPPQKGLLIVSCSPWDTLLSQFT